MIKELIEFLARYVPMIRDIAKAMVTVMDIITAFIQASTRYQRAVMA